jgi:phage shock protein PspC (stress-responsive transcriptional regulator)
MNRTIDITLGGMVFHIDENAYPILNNYLQALKKHFATQASGDEVMTDIEIRIAETFQKQTNITKQNITIIDVEEVMQTMGSPENFETETEPKQESSNNNSYSSTASNNATQPVTKRIYRDTDKRVLGGVSAGISNYFGWDPLFMRIAFLIAIFGFGVGTLVYLVLWIIIPEAKTSAEKLQMHGEPVTIANIEKTIKNEYNTVNENFKSNKFGTQLADATRGISDNIIKILTTIFKILGTIFAVIGTFIGVILLLFLCQFVFGSDAIMNIGDEGVHYWPNAFRLSNFFDDKQHVWQAELALLLVLGVPLIAMVYNGIRVLLGVERNKYFTRTASVMWVIGVVLSIVSFNRINKAFSANVALKNSVYLTTNSNKTIVLKAQGEVPENYNKSTATIGSIFFSFDNNESSIKQGLPKLKIFKSANDSAYIIISKQANSSTKKLAADLANQLNYNIQLTDTIVAIDNMFNVTNMSKWRNQKLVVKVYLPVGQKIFIDPSVVRLLNDVDNVSNTYDGDMINHTWQMQVQGLVCLDKLDESTSIDNDNYSDNNDDNDDAENDNSSTKKKSKFNMSINNKGVFINGKRIDENSTKEDRNIEIDVNDVDVKIDEKGVSANVKGNEKK